MTFAWPDYLSVADDLLGMPQRTAGLEAVARAAVSRAYYAAHRVAHDELTIRRNMPLPDVPGGVHMQVIQAFFTVKHRAWGRVGQELDGLRKARVQADYELPLPSQWGSGDAALRKKAEFEVLRARRLLQDLATLPQIGQL